jgi:hypothetical protein
MSLWGNKDSFSSGLKGTITITLSGSSPFTVTGSGTSFTTAGISTGDVIVVGAGATMGQAVVTGVTSERVLSIGSTQFLITNPATGAIAGAAYTANQKPKYTFHDHQYNAPESKTTGFSTSPVFTAVFGVDTTETTVAAGRTVGGKNAAYAVAHAGWVGVTTYVDQHGNFRVKSETLVAGSSITNDADDNIRYPNS